jgi:glucosamine--fructose-6-phosphate aminotransferase (isomerizing)
MCGIFAYFGTKEADSIVRQGLQNLEYRGYDSWGIAVTDRSQVRVVKAIGEVPKKLSDKQKMKGQIGLGHTRWATNGGVTRLNAHPHRAQSGKFVVVHNGIVENADELKSGLIERGWRFQSETDTEAIVYLLEEVLQKQQNLVLAVKAVSALLQGRNTFGILTKSGELLAMKKGSPLVVGRSKTLDEYFLSSDTASLVGLADQFLVLDDRQLVVVRKNGVELPQLGLTNEKGETIQAQWEKLGLDDQSSKLTEKHYMIQEILETPSVMKTLARQSKAKYQLVALLIKQAKKVFVIGSGSTGLAAASIASHLRESGEIEAIALVGAEASSYLPFVDKHTVIISPSQSGETADVLEVLIAAKQRGAKLITFVNMPGSSMARLADVSCMTKAGPERCVMSTKVFSAQIVWGYLIAQALAGKFSEAQAQVTTAAHQLVGVLADKTWLHQIVRLAESLKSTNDIYLLGTGGLLPIAQEGMVKLIEGSYKHAHALPAGDLKHYAITLMEAGVPVILLDPGESSDRQAIITAAHEVGARGARTIGIGPSPTNVFSEYLQSPDFGELQVVASVVVLQLLSYHLTVMLGLPVDKPRNIAKSVTVK